MTPRPGPVSGTGPEFLPGLPHRYGFSPHGNGAGASRPCIGYSGNKTRLRFLGLATFDRQHVLLGGDGDLVGRKAG